MLLLPRPALTKLPSLVIGCRTLSTWFQQVSRTVCGHEFDKEHVEYVVHCEGVPCRGEDSCQVDSTVPLSIENTQGRKVWIDATICELDRLTSTLETIATQG